MAEQGAKQGDTGWRKWARGNHDAEIEYACRDLAGCGYYVDEDNYARTFDQPGSNWGDGSHSAWEPSARVPRSSVV